MPALAKAPTPAQFAAAWSARFERIVRDEGGRDGRLSRAGAHRIKHRGGGDEHFADDALRALERRGQQTISVDRLVREAHDEVLAAATLVAGPNQKISLVEGALLPSHLVRDFMLLRGKLVESARPLSGQALKDAVSAMVQSAFDNNAQKLAMPPRVVRGVRPVVEHFVHSASSTRAEIYVAGGRVFASRASSTPSPLVGWYDVGPVPTE